MNFDLVFRTDNPDAGKVQVYLSAKHYPATRAGNVVEKGRPLYALVLVNFSSFNNH